MHNKKDEKLCWKCGQSSIHNRIFFCPLRDSNRLIATFRQLLWLPSAERPVVLTNAAGMREVGVQANEILALPIPKDAAALRRAGFSLRELVRAHAVLGSSIHPPVTKRTLFSNLACQG